MLKNYKGDKFYNGSALWKQGAPWNVILSERSDGKSLWFLKQCVIDYVETGHKIAYVRRYEDNIKQKDVNLYFRDPNFLKWLTAGTEYTGVKCVRGELWFTVWDDSYQKHVDKDLFGYIFALNVQEKYKSLHYDGVYNIIFEEFITDKFYLANESMYFNHLISTICRSGKFRAILIGNTISRDCPYLLDFGIDLFKTNAGKMYEYNLKKSNGTTVKCVFDYASPHEKDSFFFGKAEKNIDRGEWETEEMPQLFFKFKDAEILYRCAYVTKLHQAFRMAVCMYKDKKYLFVYPAKYEETLDSYDDVFSDSADFERGFFMRPEKKRHAKIWRLIRAKRVLYSDNLTGTEFNKALKVYNPFIM